LEAATPGLCIVLLIGGLLPVLAPLTLLVGYGLATRVRTAGDAVRRTFAIALGVLGFLALVSGLNVLTLFGDFGDWWDATGGWAQLISWVVLATTLGLVARGLRNEAGDRAAR